MNQDDRDDVEIERRLRAYADARLAPDLAAMTRVRASVVEAASISTGEPANHAVPVLSAPDSPGRGSLRSPGRGRLRGRDPVAVIRSGDQAEATTAGVDSTLTEGFLVAGLPGAGHLADAADDEGVVTVARGSQIETSPRVRRAELIPVFEAPPPVQRGRWIRRGAAVLLAAGLLLGGAVVVSAAPPDSPLYDTRLLLENLTLPAAASARAEARVAALQERIKEAKGAASGNNAKAVAAALKAYRASVKDALKEAGDDAAALERLYAALGLHVEALQTIDAANVGDAQSAIDNALQDSQNAVIEIEQRGHGKPATNPGRGPKG